jgi:lipid II:glycine glycyltransferase (peptidoglycan interpeptide bridge formation enzyme)
MEIVNHLDSDIWKKYVEDHPQGNIFHTPEMYAVFSQTQGYSPSLWAAVDGDQVVAIMLPVEVTLYSWLKRFTSRAIVYGGVLCDPGPEGLEGLIRLLEQYKRVTRNRNIFTEIRNISDTSEFQSTLQSNTFVYEEHLNYLIKLSRPQDEILGSIHKRTRKHIRRALRKDQLTIKTIKEKEHLAECYNLLVTTYQRANVPLAHKTLFESAFDVLSSKEMVKFYIGYVDGIPVATSIELFYKDVIYGWYSGLDRSYSSYIPNELIMWHILSWGAENNYNIYDFGGAGKPDEDYGVRDFKAKFGGDLVNFGRNVWISHPTIFQFSKAGYKILRRFL